MSKFSLCNVSSINLNFLVYIKNLYENFYKPGEINGFPWFPLEKDALLDSLQFKIKAQKLWPLILNYYNICDCEKDLEYWTNDEFLFNNLFKSNCIGVESYKSIKKSYEYWYWGTGNTMCSMFSNDLVLKYYDNLVSNAKLKELVLKDIRFNLQIVYDLPYEGYEYKNKDLIVISPQSDLPTIEEFDVTY